MERQRLQTEQSLAQAEATLTDDYLSLQKALGLGWGASDGGAAGAAASEEHAER